MGAHAFFAPSSAPRVVACPGSLLLTAGMPDTQSVDAAHGTAAHWIADLSLRHRKLVKEYAGCSVAVSDTGECRFQHEKNRDEIALELAFGKAYLFEVDEEMVVAVQEYVDWCNDLPGEKHPECRVDISPWCPQVSDNVFVPPEAFEPQGGTSDHAACSPGRLVITDLKYGKGVKVFAEWNYQAVLYALGFIAQWDWLYDFGEIQIRICQPRLDHKDTWTITRKQIEGLGEFILHRFTLALKEDAPFNPGEKQCKFCKASGLCRAQSEYLSSLRALAFDDLDGERVFVEPDPRLLTEAELVEAWKAHGLYKARFDAIEREMLKALENDVPLPGVRLVMANTNRAWSRSDEVIADDIVFATGLPKEKLFKPPSLISPAQVEKLLPKRERGIVNTLAYKPRGGPCIADEDDKRPDYKEAIEAQAGEAFTDLDEDPFA